MTGQPPPLPPALALKHVTAQSLIRGRHACRDLGNAAATDILTESALDSCGPIVVTTWPRGHGSTWSPKEPGRRGLGRRRVFPDHLSFVSFMTRHAPKIVPKSTGLVFSHGDSECGGSADRECLSRSAILCDADDVGSWEVICRALAAANISYFAARRDGTERFHVVIPFAKPWVMPADRGAYKAEYQARLGWILGFLSELGGLSFQTIGTLSASKMGFDAKTDRLLTLEYPVTRRTAGELNPECRYHDGARLDIETFLRLSGFHEAMAEVAAARATRATPASRARPAVRRLPASAAPAPCTSDQFISDDPWLRAYLLAGWVLNPISVNKHSAVCPFAAGHSTASTTDSGSNSSTVIFLPSAGGHAHWHCSHGSCAERTREHLYAAMPLAAQRIIDGAYETRGHARLHAMLADSSADNDVTMVERDDVGPLVMRLLHEWKPGQVTVIQTPCGAGKSYGVRLAAEQYARDRRQT
ncbi:MAG: hypothetical protein WCJ30_06510 [Deltaproteobacteria bacterium]